MWWLRIPLWTLLVVIFVRATEDDECVDLDIRCKNLASIGECVRNARAMKRICPVSCHVCEEEDDDEEEEDEEEEDNEDYDEDEDEILEDEDDEFDDADNEQEGPKVPEAIYWSSGADMGDAQRVIYQETRPEDLLWTIAKARNYMKQIVPNKFSPSMGELCRNRHRQCAYWAWKGECDTNAAYMKTNCAPMCQSCHYLTPEVLCALQSNQTNTWSQGDLNRLFEKWTSEPFLSTYSVQVLSSPSNDRPWVISMDGIVTEVEASHLIELGHEVGFRRSTNRARGRPDRKHRNEVVRGRTSMNTWCTGTCADDPLVQQVSERLSELTGISIKNMEWLQFLKYEVGQMHGSHHDFIDGQVSTQAGPRILTVFIYLNDVEEGGGTHFEELDVTVLPKRGRVLIWPNVLDQNPIAPDWRTIHDALPVENGVKYGANAWYHLRDFQTPNENGCMI